MKPTCIYTKPVVNALAKGRGKPAIHGMAHITGGGLAENIARVLPEGSRVALDLRKVDPHPAYTWLQSLGHIDRDEMYRVFNMGIGFVMVVGSRQASGICQQIESHGVPARVIGRVVEGDRGVDLKL